MVRIYDTMANKDPLNINPFDNTHKMSELTHETLMGDCYNQVSMVRWDCLKVTTHDSHLTQFEILYCSYAFNCTTKIKSLSYCTNLSYYVQHERAL